MCVFVRPDGHLIVDDDAWDKTVAEIDWGKHNVPSENTVALVDAGSSSPLDASVVPYPREVCDRLIDFGLNRRNPPEKLKPPQLTMVVTRRN